MDLLPSETTSQIAKKHGFRSLKLVNVDLDQVLDQPVGADYGRIDNGLFYYVRRNSKPRMHAALALAVKAGSVLEEEEERGVAHIVEHLAFSATTKYTNHDIVKFLEGIRAEFGACQNAVTSADETVYELFVPVDKPELLSQAFLSWLNSVLRYQMTSFLCLFWNADRLRIGLEKFYRKWYHLQNMAVIAVGDFSDTQSVVELIKMHFGHKYPEPDPLLIPIFEIPTHEEPHFSCFVESEAAGVSAP
ncbi:hypothetical protein GH714_038912 [Hevea brasiliensis]|uniref:Peptidase M16 N-terminal domain-containing protein n=1 Tax=Hevea brasiliensis TaxID=3981 RepID=A0A6A6K8Q9_HEVBR|nr:hypothetical protein GH714_038912 [Hevea brasiliensis]